MVIHKTVIKDKSGSNREQVRVADTHWGYLGKVFDGVIETGSLDGWLFIVDKKASFPPWIFEWIGQEPMIIPDELFTIK